MAETRAVHGGRPWPGIDASAWLRADAGSAAHLLLMHGAPLLGPCKTGKFVDRCSLAHPLQAKQKPVTGALLLEDAFLREKRELNQ